MIKNLFLTAVCAVLVCAGLSGCQSHPGRQDTEKGLRGQNVSSAVITGAALGGDSGTGQAVSGRMDDDVLEKPELDTTGGEDGNPASASAISGKYPVVTDETGQKRELRLGNVDMKDKGVEFCDASSCVGDYSQVAGNHYYYLRMDHTEKKYTLYRDQGQRVGEFRFSAESEKYHMNSFVKAGEDYYALLDYEYVPDPEEYDYIYKHQIVRVDMKKERTELVSQLPDEDIFDLPYDPPYWYRGAIYYYNYIIGTVMKVDTARKKSKKVLFLNNDAMYSGLVFLGGKIYYPAPTGTDYYMYSFDLGSGERQEVLHYGLERYTEHKFYMLDIDKDYVYISNVIVPRKGGKMVPIGDLYEEKNMPGNIIHNKKYVFYIDGDDRIHRIDKKTRKDVIISTIKAMGIECTEDSLYVQGYDKHYLGDGFFDDCEDYDEDDEHSGVVPNFDDYSFDLYYMDLDGKHRKRLWKGDGKSYKFKDWLQDEEEID